MPLSRILPPRRRSMKSSTPTTSGWPSGTNAFTSRPSRILEPCRPDHTPRDKNRWNRLNPLSEAPSTARSAEHTVRRFRHSTAPVASSTAFSHVGCVNIAANGASQISIAQAFPGCAIFATIGFPATNTRETSLRPTESPNLRTSSRLRRRYQAVWEIAKVQLRFGGGVSAGVTLIRHERDAGLVGSGLGCLVHLITEAVAETDVGDGLDASFRHVGD